jgi:DNA-binding transcriptional MocR family regulator
MEKQPQFEPPRGGFIKLYRSLKGHWLWSDAERLKWWIDILMTVNYEPGKALINGALVPCDRGESLRSIGTWAREWGVHESKVRRFFAMLESDGMIITKGVGKTTRLTVCNYASYNDVRRTDDEQTTSTRRSGDEQATTIKEGEEIKEEKKRIASPKRKTGQAVVPPAVEEVVQYFTENGYSELAARKAWSYYAAGNWHDSHGKPVKSWKQKMNSVWFRPENIASAKPEQRVYHLSIPPELNVW